MKRIIAAVVFAISPLAAQAETFIIGGTAENGIVATLECADSPVSTLPGCTSQKLLFADGRRYVPKVEKDPDLGLAYVITRVGWLRAGKYAFVEYTATGGGNTEASERWEILSLGGKRIRSEGGLLTEKEYRNLARTGGFKEHRAVSFYD